MQELRIKHVGRLVKTLRQAAKLRQCELAHRMGYASGGQFVSNWERGVSLPPIADVPKLAGLLGVPTRSLLVPIFNCREAELHRVKTEAMRKHA